MKRIFYILMVCVAANSCSRKKEFTVEGEVSEASGKTLYFEKTGLSRTELLDSVRLGEKGNFRFRQPAVAEPEFYRLRLGSQQITLAIDSNETVQVDATATDFARGYQVSGSPESEKIKTVTLEGMGLKERMTRYNKMYSDRQLSVGAYSDSLLDAVNDYKAIVVPYIYENPRSATAYFTLFQRIDGLLIFDPFDKADYRAYGAVATSWDLYHKESERSRQLTDIALNAFRTHRAPKGDENANIIEAKEQNQIEIVLPDITGKTIKLSDMKGKVVLLDFTAYETEYSAPYNMALAKLYDKFKSKGFDIYQVSLDTDENFWKVTASNLPWVSVRDQESIYSRFARSYNVTSLPTAFLLDRDGSIVARGTDLKDIESSISKLL